MIDRIIWRVEWIDSTVYTHWREPREEPYELDHCVSVGFLLEATDEHVALAQSFAEHGDLRAEVIVIPRACITKAVAWSGAAA